MKFIGNTSLNQLYQLSYKTRELGTNHFIEMQQMETKTKTKTNIIVANISYKVMINKKEYS